MASPNDEITQARSDAKGPRDDAHDALKGTAPDVPTAVSKFGDAAKVYQDAADGLIATATGLENGAKAKRGEAKEADLREAAKLRDGAARLLRSKARIEQESLDAMKTDPNDYKPKDFTAQQKKVDKAWTDAGDGFKQAAVDHRDAAKESERAAAAETDPDKQADEYEEAANQRDAAARELDKAARAYKRGNSVKDAQAKADAGTERKAAQADLDKT